MSYILIVEAEGIPRFPTIAKAVRMGRTLLSSLLKIVKRSFVRVAVVDIAYKC